jgi:general secretion pathway protein M
MNAAALTLPEGRQGKALAVGITLAGLALVWFAVIFPILSWYQSRAAELAQNQAIAAHMAALTQEIPQLRKAVAAARPQSQDQQILLSGATDAIAGANLQTDLQNLAQTAGTSLDSSEVMPVQQDGALRRIGIQVSLTADWPTLIAFLQAIGTARPRMIIDQLSLMNSSQSDSANPPVQANFSVSAFSAGTP